MTWHFALSLHPNKQRQHGKKAKFLTSKFFSILTAWHRLEHSSGVLRFKNAKIFDHIKDENLNLVTECKCQ